ncbi:hypothetical protein [Joostella sp.]|uniref:hypothetical protein n=1 Tax=Joostella sp. TaxID=2231138 RepID=UPI003A91AC79
MKNKLLLLFLMLTLVLACSKDEENLEDIEAIEWSVEIGNVTATSVTFSDYSLRGGQRSKFGYRKIGDDNFSHFEISTDGLTGLEPLTDYEIRIFELGTANYSSKVVSFTTLPFDADYSSFNSDTVQDTIASYEGFEHSFKVINELDAESSISGRLKSTAAHEDVMVQNIKLENGMVYFTVPENIIPDGPYEYKREYYLELMINGKPYSFGENAKGENVKIFMVYNKKPFIENVKVKLINNGGTLCNNLSLYNIQLEGAFLSHVEDHLSSTCFIDDSSLRTIITNTETNELLMYQIDDNTICRKIGRRNWEDYKKDDEEDFFLTYQYTNWIGLNDFISEHGLHPGEYSIRVVFEKGDEFYETNEFLFTIEE